MLRNIRQKNNDDHTKQYSPRNTRKAPRDFAQKLDRKFDKKHSDYRHPVSRKRKLYDRRGKRKGETHS